ncbi:hypothetical protein CRM22_002313 [Opisthorchis felineus]|uniref:Peptidase A1 domain-containing protein n=1 Tax=Opisthorchis felineus TaxID=147828 RepID=A0A4S2MCL4_OPIFE|nr:hypothetical protein CRM22_002313 [Opisthorchis felineus]
MVGIHLTLFLLCWNGLSVNAESTRSGDGLFRNGVFSFGGIHQYRYEQPLLYFPLVSADSWTIQATRISLGRNVICQQDCSILFNTAVRFLYGPQQQIDRIHQSLHEANNRMSDGVYSLICDKASSYPLLRVQFDSIHVDWRMNELWEKRRYGRGFACKSGMRTSTLTAGWTFGHMLMYKLFTVFDLKCLRMGLAKASRP